MKYDGYRAIAAIAGDQVRLYTRNANDWTTQFGRRQTPEQADQRLASPRGEIVAFKDGRTDSRRSRMRCRAAPTSPISSSMCWSRRRGLHRLPLSAQERLAKIIASDRSRMPSSIPHILVGPQFFDAMCEGL